ncbi:MAG: hypothetical protein JW817_06845, partial [Clostridiales bacterium]|nr:hypothetical protein [Clostridiales bacterium]
MKKRKPDPKFERSGADGEVRPVGRPGNVLLPEFSEMIDEAPDKEEPSKIDNIGTALESVEPDQVEEVNDHDETDNTDKALNDTETDNIDEVLEDTEPDPSEPDPDVISDEGFSIPSPSLSFASEDPVLFRDSDDLIFPETDDDDPDLQGLSAVRISKDATIFEPRVRKLSWLKPRHIILPLIAIAVVLFSVFVILVRDKNVRSASPLIIRGIAVSNAEFSFIYNY